INPELHIMNGYGPTEATISCTMEVIRSAEDITIGIPNANVYVATVDRNGQLQPLGATGELVILGEGVGRGYIGRDDLNRKSFITLLGKRAYRSGDLARIREDGKIEFHGRMDDQVKLRGLRIELGEVENAISTYPSIRSNAVMVVHGETDYLAACFTADEPVDITKLREHLSRRLTAYMVPQSFIQLESMPMTANGKINRKALPELSRADSSRKVKQPQNEMQRKLCELFSRALGMETGIDDDFFALGGTSLTAAKVLMGAMVQQIPLEYQDIFDAKTVENLEALIRRRQNGKPADLPVRPPEERKAVRFEKALSHNRHEYAAEIREGSLGNVLLAGAAGFLGIHVLKELLENSDSRIVCMVHGRANVSPESRLRLYLFYYFEKDYLSLYKDRITVIERDLTDAEGLMDLVWEDFDTVINCAASVKHFADFDFLKRVNVDGVENLIRLCLRKKARLIHVSTVSVSGEALNGESAEAELTESSLDIGQDVASNAYVYTKYLAEEKILQAVEEQGLDAKIMRVSNLMSRYADEEFQINFRTNSFMNSLRAYVTLGCFPYSGMDEQVDFSPIDETARYIVRLAGTPAEFTVFHVYNSHSVDMADVLEAMKRCGIEIRPVTDEEFTERLNKGLADDRINSMISPLVDYDLTDDELRGDIPCDNRFTVQALSRLGERWSITDMDYLEKMIQMLQLLGFFDIG
ncbi:MAG: SDR family oxidoreductase, partial [Clostridia bacterium]|nr:SDR family oxidoreductase [Clostridia bacterium]